jgi:CheY-like chemotaxis protein
VDDHPENNTNERRAFEAMGLRFTLALSTDEALRYIQNTRFAAILSDMGRREGQREGYRLLDAVREHDGTTPFFIYAGSNAPEHLRETIEHKGQGCTSNPQELFQLVTKAVISQFSQ